MGKASRIKKNKETIRDNAVDMDVIIAIVDGNIDLVNKANKIKKLLADTNPSSDRKVIKLDNKINKTIYKIRKKSEKYIRKNKQAKLLMLFKKLEIAIVERGCRNRKTTTNDEKDFVIKDGVLKEYIGNDSEIVLPNSVKAIGEKAFYYNNAISTVEANVGVTVVGEKAFEGCQALTSVYLPTGVGLIGDDAFYNCGALTDVVFEDGLTSIGKYAFAKCPNLYAIKIPKSVAKIGEKAFFLDKNLKGRTKRRIKKINKMALK